MYLEELDLEVTRNCTLACEHCLRGEALNVNMSLETLENLFSSVNGIGTLLLTGGEPLIAVQALERMIEIIKARDIKIGKILLITNGTILSERVIRILAELKEIGNVFDLKVSANIFHMLELERLGFVSKRNYNYKVLHALFGAEEYAKDNPEYWESSLLVKSGRMATIRYERLQEINRMAKTRYYTEDWYYNSQPETHIVEDCVSGVITVDVYGNLVSYGQEFIEEDREAIRLPLNINKMPFREAVEAFVKNDEEKRILAARFDFTKVYKY